MKPWRRLGAERLQRCRVFDLDRVRFEGPDGARDFFVVEAPDWINVIPLTGDRRVLLVRQFRFGTASLTLEIPGGMCDEGETPEAAARRELLEETGHAARELTPLGWVHPNPAVQTNRCHTFLAEGVYPVGPPKPDPDEAFEFEFAPLESIPSRIASGEISHSLVVAAFYLFGLRGLAPFPE